jgi:tripartite-type tricarboxylate transporter receptor subunit TctC
VTPAPAGARRVIRRAAAFALAAAFAGLAGAATAQPAAEFYLNHKTLTLVISSSPGGGYDGYGCMFARTTSRHLSGNPTFVLHHMPGAGGAQAAIQRLYATPPAILARIQKMFAASK